MRKALLAAVLLVASPLLAGCLSGGDLVGEPAPAFEFVTNEGQVVNNSTYLGQWVILDLMATWCGPCRLEVAHLREIQERYGDRVVIISIGADPSETMADLEAFGERYGANWPYAIDRNGTLGRTFQVNIIPKLVIIDPDGVVAFERQGEVLPAAIARVIDPGAVSGGSPLPVLGGLVAGAAVGFLAPFNPYRRLHRDGASRAPMWIVLGLFVALALLAWPYAAIVSSRATYGSLIVGVASLGALAWWWRARRSLKDEAPPEGGPLAQAGDRAYETAPHFALALLLGLRTSTGALAFFAPVAGFALGVAGATFARARLGEPARTRIGLAGLAVVGLALVAFGARILLAEP